MENCLTSVELQSFSKKALLFDIMIRLILVSLFLHGSQANHCFDRANSNSCFLVGKMMSHQRVEAMMQITNYHCIMKCANMLSKATMDLALDNMHEKFNHQCTVF